MNEPAPIRLVHVTTVSDSLVFFAGQIGFMRRRGFDVALVSSPDQVLDAFGGKEGIVTYGVRMQRRISPFADLDAVFRLMKLLLEIRPHIVHTHTPKAGFLGMLAASLTGVPVRVYQMRGLLLLTARGRRRLLLHAIERASCLLADRVICNSHSLRQVALTEGLCSAESSEVLLSGSGNGIDSRGRFNPAHYAPDVRSRIRAQSNIPEDAPVIGFVGRLVGDKGVHELVEAWQGLREEFPSAHLLLVGPFEPRDPVEPGARHALESDPRVHLLGFQSDPVPFYMAMDVLALPTYREGFPNVLLEASSMTLPVVATRVPGCVDAVADGQTGALVPARDASALRQALAAYLRAPALGREHGRAGRERVIEHFDQERLWQALERVYRTLLQEKCPSLEYGYPR